MNDAWQGELARGMFIIAGALIAFSGAMFSQWRQEKRDRNGDARALRDAKRERLESAYLPVLLAARSMWELTMRQGKKPEQVEGYEEREYLTRLWDRTTVDVEEALIKLNLETDPGSATASKLFDQIRSDFFAYLGYRQQDARSHESELAEDVLASRQSVYSGLVKLENLSRKQLRQLSRPLPPNRARLRNRDGRA